MRRYGGNTLMWLDTNAANVPCPNVVITALIARVRELEGLLDQSRRSLCTVFNCDAFRSLTEAGGLSLMKAIDEIDAALSEETE